jgi:asparagine synthase (glutamine-hydrolysing)
MCGITGFTGRPEPEALTRMMAALIHRGPDEDGRLETSDVSLGMRRLSIVDLATGKQPVSNEDGTIWAIFNGEIYNHLELRRDLEQAGHTFSSHHSDTEVLVHMYEDHGADYLNYLNGMFAIALWDTKRQELHLARDRVGIKPLFFSRTEGGVVFGSEIKALLAHPRVPKQPDFHALHHYFSFKNVPAPLSAFKGIEQLRPGERAVVTGAGVTRHRWWRLLFSEEQQITPDEASAHLRALLADSVRLQMRSDVPFGAYLSGGLDSSTVVALMAESGASRVQTFSLTYADDFAAKDADRQFARLVSELYGTEHYEYVMHASEIVETLDDVLAAFDEPFSGVTSTYFLTRLISQHVKVALSGDGADELFGSYLPHRLAQPLQSYGPLQHRIGQLTNAERNALEPFVDQPAFLGRTWQRGDEAARRMGQYLWDESGKSDLYTETMRQHTSGVDTESLVRDLYLAAQTCDPLNRALFVDFETLLPDQVLAFVDRLSMAHSVEVRPPYLDHRVVEFAARLPGRLKIAAGRGKHILKEAVHGLLPAEVINRPKEGFVLPINAWLLGSLEGLARDVLSPQRLGRHGLLNQDAVQSLLAAHYAGSLQHGPRLWSLIVFQTWWDRQFD